MNKQELKIDTDRLTLVQGLEHEVWFNESHENVSERWVPVIKHGLCRGNVVLKLSVGPVTIASGIETTVAMSEKKDRPKGKQPKGPGGFETIADFSWTDGAALPTVPEGKKRGTIIEQTKPTT